MDRRQPFQRVTLPASSSAIINTTQMLKVKSAGMKNVMGSPAHIITGRCAIQSLNTNAGSAFVFTDSGGNQSNYIYMNPRICCQNTGYSVPAGYCPIGVISQPYRRFSFRRVILHYVPTSASTSMAGTVALAYDPEVITTSTLGTQVMAFANFEASVFGPVWSPLSLDITRFLDRSKWFYSETGATLATSLLSSQSIQGTILLCGSTGPAVSTYYGMFQLEFELALDELGPVEVYSAPALSSSSSSSCKGIAEHVHDENLKEEIVYVSRAELDKIIKTK